MRAIAAGIGFILIVGTFVFVGNAVDFANFKFWAPKYENARREVFENTQSYVQGKASYIAQLRLDYEAAEPGSAHAASIRRMILTEASTVDVGKLPVDTQNFIQKLKGGL